MMSAFFIAGAVAIFYDNVCYGSHVGTRAMLFFVFSLLIASDIFLAYFSSVCVTNCVVAGALAWAKVARVMYGTNGTFICR